MDLLNILKIDFLRKGLYERITDLKSINPELKILIAVGGKAGLF